VLAGDSGGAPDAVLEGETGYVVDGRDVSAVASRLIRMLTDPDLREQLGTSGRRWVEQNWRWDVVADRLTDLLND
jgi:phosphatidylinositol alpha-1,6-mannosyltransferase